MRSSQLTMTSASKGRVIRRLSVTALRSGKPAVEPPAAISATLPRTISAMSPGAVMATMEERGRSATTASVCGVWSASVTALAPKAATRRAASDGRTKRTMVEVSG
jgi:hypothetical protein